MRSNRGKRIFRETSEAPVWYLQLWQSLTVDLTSERGIISTIDKSGFLRTFTSTIMPGIASVLIIAPIVNTWQTFKNFYRSKNKNLDKYLDLFVNIFMTLTSVGVMATLLAGFVYVSPYILLSAMMVSLSYGIYNVTKHIYAAWCANEEGDKERVKQHLWAVPYHAVLTILSCLGLLVQLHYAFNMVALNGMFRLVQISNSSYTVAQVLLYVFGFSLTLSTMPAFARQIMEYNYETWNLLSNPVKNINEFLFGKVNPEGQKTNGLWDNIKNGVEYCKTQPLQAVVYFLPVVFRLAAETIGYAAIVGIRLIAGLLAPLQLLGALVTTGISLINNFISPPPLIPNLGEDPVSQEQHQMNKNSMREMLTLRHQNLRIAVKEEKDHLHTQEPTPKIQSKWHFIINLEKKLGSSIKDFDKTTSLDALEADAMKISPYLYQSFWRQEGRVEKIARQFDELEEGLLAADTQEYLETPRHDKRVLEEEKEQTNDSIHTPFIRAAI